MDTNHLFFLLAIASVTTCHTAALGYFNWNPQASVVFENGEYWGEDSGINADTGISVPHGDGSWILNNGRVLYTGRWRQGHMHGVGKRYFQDGRNYSGNFDYDSIKGNGTMWFPNGTVYKGNFHYGIMMGNAEIIYPNGDKRIGYLSPNATGHWDGVATFIEANGFSTSSEEIGLGFFDESVKGNKWSEKWILKNSSSTYKPEARIYKSVINKYDQETVVVQIVCKVHSSKLSIAKAAVYHEGTILDANESKQEGDNITKASNLDEEGWLPEIQTLTVNIPFNRESLGNYSCIAVDPTTEEILHQDTLYLRNPFLFEANGECGSKIVSDERPLGNGNKVRKRRGYSEKFRSGIRNVKKFLKSFVKRPVSASPLISFTPTKVPLIVMGESATLPGEIPWQALLHSDVIASNSLFNEQPLGDFCGGVIISPWHILTAAHCIAVGNTPEVGLNRNLNENELTIKIGFTTRPWDYLGSVYEVKRIYVHGKFDRETLFNDIALLTLKKKILFNGYVAPVCLPHSEGYLDKASSDANKLTVSGFGLTVNISNLYSGTYQATRLQIAQNLQILPKIDCFPPDQEINTLFEGHFCAGVTAQEASTIRNSQLKPSSCKGDSGGPLTQRQRNGRHSLIGLVSSGPEPCGIERGGVYVNVAHYLEWIHLAKLQDMVDDFKDSNRRKQILRQKKSEELLEENNNNFNFDAPYHKLDRQLFETMLKYLSKEADEKILTSVYQ